ncbi:MAG: OmpA family protein [Ignavibacteria bacterium]|nr:OmpA family protein [Ignavibacteria bacterium]
MNRFHAVIVMVFTILLSSVALHSQTKPYVPWSYGAHLGVNYNMSGVGYGKWIQNGTIRDYGQFIPYVRNDGMGLGLYLGLNAQYMPTNWFGLQGRLSYDQRSFTANDNQTFQNPDGTFQNDEFDFHLGLINFELLGKLYLTDRFHFTGGLGLGVKLASKYDAKPEGSPVISDLEIPGSSLVGSLIGGFGYEIALSDAAATRQWTLTPFAEATYMFGMREVDFAIQSGFADGLSVITVRAGAVLAFGDAKDPLIKDATRFFRVSPPEDGIYAKRIVEEFIPLLPFVFFDSNDVAIPSRYNNVTSSDTASLIKRSREEFDAEDLTNVEARKYRQGDVYYNFLNIVGNRLRDNPNVTVMLIGSDPKEKNGEELANSVEKYLTETWGIANSRISTKGQIEPRIPSGTSRTPVVDRPAAEVENRRVEITSNNPDITRRAKLKAERVVEDENDIDVEITTNEEIESWQATITGGTFKKSYGPFTGREVYIDPTGMLADDKPRAEFSMEVIAKTKDGRTLSELETFTLTRSTKDAFVERHSLVFEYNDADPEGKAKQFLEDIAPRIHKGDYVYISGYTDNLGNEDVNMKLSVQRAKQVRQLLQTRMQKLGVKVVLRDRGFGEDPAKEPFTNAVPEGRMYNRTVIVDIIH